MIVMYSSYKTIFDERLKNVEINDYKNIIQEFGSSHTVTVQPKHLQYDEP